LVNAWYFEFLDLPLKIRPNWSVRYLSPYNACMQKFIIWSISGGTFSLTI